MVVQHNLTAMNANRMLNITTSQQAKSTEKLSSGYRINRAADDAAGLSISEKMRKQIRGLTQASSNAQDGISAVQTAEGALTEVTSMLQRMNELAVQASNSTNSETDRDSIQKEIDQLKTEIDRVSETTKFNETYLLKGDKNGNKSADYTYASQAAVASQTLYTVGTDGAVTTVYAGEVLKTDATYYTQYSKIGDKISSTDLTSATLPGSKLVGVAIGSTDLTSSTYATSITVINTDSYYTKDSNNNYVAVTKGSEVQSVSYYTLTTNADGKVDYKAVDVSSLSTAAGYKVAASVTIYDSDGNKMNAGDIINTGATYYSDISNQGYNPYCKEIQVFNTDGYFALSGAEYVAVKVGEEYDAAKTYYTVNTGTTDGQVKYDAVAGTVTAGDLETGYKAIRSDFYDANGNTVTMGAIIDEDASYFTTVANIVTGAVANIKDVSVASTEFQFCDKDGNEIAANGLRRYFNENGEYDENINGGLYFKNGEKAKVAEVNAYVEKTQASVGKLNLSFQVGSDATEENKISIELEAMSAKSLGIDNIKVSGNDDKNALNAIETISAALEKVSEQRSSLGAIQNRLEHTIANLDNVVENTTAAESQIRDTDMAEEMVTFSKNNILAQAGQSMLAQANQSNQGVLSLLG